MSTPSTKSKRRTVFLTLFILFWVGVTLWTINKVKPEFWKDGYTYYQEAQGLSGAGETEKALDVLDKALNRDPNNAGYLVFKASLEEKADRLSDAMASYSRALELKPGDPEASLGLGKLLLSEGQEKEAEKVLATLPPEGLEIPLLERRAGLQAQYGEQVDAIADYEHLLKQSPGNPKYLRALAASAMAIKDWGRADDALNKLLSASNDQNVQNWAQEQLIIVLRAENKPAEAYALLNAHPDASNAPLRAQLAMELERFDEAVPLLEKIIQSDPTNVKAKNQLAIALRALGKSAEAYALFTSVPDADNLRARAELALELDKFAEAATLYKALAKEYPNDVHVMEQLAYALDRTAQTLQAQTSGSTMDETESVQEEVASSGDTDGEEAYRQALASGEASKGTRVRYAWLLMREKRYAEAFDALGPLANVNASRDILKLAANAAFLAGKFDQAQPLLEKLHELEPGNKEVTNQLAIAIRTVKKPAKAYALFTSVPNVDNLRARAELALELNKYAEAATLYAELAKIHPDNVKIKEQLAYALDQSTQASLPAKTEEKTSAEVASLDDYAAEKEYRKALASGKASEETRIRYAWLLMREKRYAEAFDTLGDVAHTDAREEVLELAANAAFLAGKYDQAIPLLLAWSERQPQNASVWLDLADAYDARKEPGAAAQAMGQYLKLTPNDDKNMLKWAGLLARSGKTSQAEAVYRQLLANDPGNQQAVIELATLYESRRQFSAAISVLSKGGAESRQAYPNMLYRLARLYSFTKNYPAAIRAYTHLLAMKGVSPRARATSNTSLIEAYLEVGDSAGAQKRLKALHAWDSRNPKLLVLAARASMDGKNPKLAVKALERLSSQRSLKPVELQWLAGQYRLIGRKDKALALYEKLFASRELKTVQGLEDLGDLRFDAKKYLSAVKAYELAIKAGGKANLSLKLARAADKAGNKALARSAYNRFLATNPNNPDVLLEIARFAINSGEYVQALSLYDRVVAARGSKGLLLELAQANLAAKRFGAAEEWARQAMQAGEGYKATLALVQALHLEGNSAEADKLLREHRREIMAHPEGQKWLGYVDVARNRQLQAYDIFTDLAKEKGPDEGKMWLWRGIAATRRGDYARARESFEKAKQFGATVPEGLTGQ
ncbi:tetratricopeptide repeat protein [Desulfovibrio inopinatus]|uniref:tetratricopeptide repeat protein n=1 Tax=Desulfovibrio inopinatus TaxID=102109 RepID=UPI00041EB933|nr:tetratricopeptide repeat protein [Desulfovibrio inopinatus]